MHCSFRQGSGYELGHVYAPPNSLHLFLWLLMELHSFLILGLHGYLCLPHFLWVADFHVADT